MKTFYEFLNQPDLNDEDYINYVNEIAELPVDTPEWVDSSDPDNAQYTMKTENHKYYVNFACGEYQEQKVCIVSFRESTGIPMVNDEDFFKVMAGLVDIIKTYVETKNIKVIGFEGEYKSNKENRNEPSRLTNLYLQYVKMQLPKLFPNAHCRRDGNFVRIFF